MKKGEVIVLILGLLIIIAMCGVAIWMITSNKEESKVQSYEKEKEVAVENKDSENIVSNTVKGEVSETKKDESSKKINKVNNDKEIVYSLYNKGNYSIPYININSSEVEEINKEVENYYKHLIEEAVDIEADVIHRMEAVKYVSYINDNILSLVISHSFNQEQIILYKVYNVDLYTGKKVSNLEIINKKNMSEVELLNKLKVLHNEKFIKECGTMESYISKPYFGPAYCTAEQFYKQQLDKTVSTDNYSIIAMPIFLDSNGKISVIAKIYTLTGAESSYYILDTGI